MFTVSKTVSKLVELQWVGTKLVWKHCKACEHAYNMHMVRPECIPALLVRKGSPDTVQELRQRKTHDTEKPSTESSCQVQILLFTLNVEGNLVR